MRLVDTHCHLDFPDYADDLEEALLRAASSGVERMVIPGTSVASSEKAVALAGTHSGIYAAVGIHPHEADKAHSSDIKRLRETIVDNDKIVAVGEIGLDNYKGYSLPENQKRLFREHLSLALELDLPVILHSRDAGEDLMGILHEADPSVLRGVCHCFSGSGELLREALDLGLFVSFAGNISFEKASLLRKLARDVPLDKLLLETDSPYLTPVPFRGKRNEPAYVRYLLDVYAGIYGRAPEDIAAATTHNANRLFCLGLEAKSTIVYQIRDSLYINVTHRCTNRCSFCARNDSDHVKGHDLRLDAEPTTDEIISALGDVSKYREIVFCGFGEPTLRLGTLKKVASFIKRSGGSVRVITNGQGNFISGKQIAAGLKGLIDRVSVSLNASDEDKYRQICRSVFGKRAYGSIVEFIRECRQHGIEVEVTCLDFVGEEEVAKVRQIAAALGADFRLRYLHAVG